MAKNIAQATAEIKSKLEKVAPLFADIFVERVSNRTPRLSGTLADAWKAQQSGNTINIINDTPYAAYVEYGTYKMEPRGMMRATMLERQEILDEAAKKAGL